MATKLYWTRSSMLRNLLYAFSFFRILLDLFIFLFLFEKVVLKLKFVLEGTRFHYLATIFEIVFFFQLWLHLFHVLCILRRNRDKSGFEIIDVLLNKEDIEVGGDIDEANEIGYFCGSPPVRTHNPVIHDAQFTKQMNPKSSFPLLSNSPLSSNPSPRVERGSSPICNPAISGSPKIRVEGFTCGESDPRCVVPTLA